MTTNYAGRIPPGRASGGAGGQPPESPAQLLADLTVHDKALLLTGADSWRTQGAEALGLRPMVMSDGPAGVRGVVLDERQPSSSLPCPSALGATWDPVLVRELAAALGAEARGKGVDVLLAPTINLMRTPLGGRGFECFAEDPVLNAGMPVLAPWADQVAAVLYAWLPGQAMGDALADVLLGPGRARRAAAGHPAGRRGRLPGPARGAARRNGRLRRGPAHRVPGLRREPGPAAVPVRPRPRLHDVGV